MEPTTSTSTKDEIVRDMKSVLTDFIFLTTVVRIVMDDNNEPWFVAKDVCDVLDLTHVSMALQRLDDDEKQTAVQLLSGQKRELSIINESGLYSLVLGSRKPEAKKFKRWITHEVLPNIRKYGIYASDDAISSIQRNPELIQKMLTDAESHKTKVRELELALIEKSKVIADYATVMFDTEEDNRVNKLVDTALQFQHQEFQYIDSLNVCYVRVLRDKYEVPNVGLRTIFKFGGSSTIKQRNAGHRYEYKNSRLIKLFVVSNHTSTQREFKHYLKSAGIHMSMHTCVGGRKHHELFYTRPDLNIDQVLNKFTTICLPHQHVSLTDKTMSDLKTTNTELRTQTKTLHRANYKLRKALERVRYELQRQSEKINKYTALKHQYTKIRDTNISLEAKLSVYERANAQSSNPVNTVNNDNSSNSGDTPIAPSLSQVIFDIISFNPTTETHNICTYCDSVYPLDQATNWPCGKPRYACPECVLTYVPPVIDESKLSAKCVICQVTKNMDGMRNGERRCKDCVNALKRHKRRVVQFDEYVRRSKNGKLFKLGYYQCTICNDAKPVAEFGVNVYGIHGLKTHCNDCRRVVYHANTE